LLLLSNKKDEESFFHNSLFPLDLLKIIIKESGYSYPISNENLGKKICFKKCKMEDVEIRKGEF
jgi:hypothetical protein